LKSDEIFYRCRSKCLLPTLEPLMKQLLARRARASRLAQQMGHLLGDYRSNVGAVELSDSDAGFCGH
jgi:hypothetical protein